MTGSEAYLYTQNLIDKDYTSFFSVSKFNKFIRSALYSEINRIYRDLNVQAAYDKLSFLIKTDQTFILNNDRIPVAPILITAMGVIGTTLTITTLSPHNLIAGDQFKISNVAGLTTIPTLNASHAVTTILTEYSFVVTITSSAGVYTANTGTISYLNMIADYLHSLAMKIQVIKPYTTVSIVSAVSGTPVTITLNKKTKLRSSTIIKITNNAVAAGTYYVKQLNDIKYTLYYDESLTLPVTAVGSPANGGDIAIVNYNWGVPYFSDRKIDSFGIPTAIRPRYEDREKEIRCYPEGLCTEIAIDYISLPPFDINGADTSQNLSIIYNDNFMYELINKTAELFSMSIRDPQFVQGLQQEIMVNNP